MKSDTSSLLHKSHFSKYFNFSSKNDPFLVYPSIKNNTYSLGGGYAQGGGVQSLKKLKGGVKNTN